jgi:hypothetical protein
MHLPEMPDLTGILRGDGGGKRYLVLKPKDVIVQMFRKAEGMLGTFNVESGMHLRRAGGEEITTVLEKRRAEGICQLVTAQKHELSHKMRRKAQKVRFLCRYLHREEVGPLGSGNKGS